MTIYWDLDGCLRLLDRVFIGREANRWGELDDKGMSLHEVFNNDPALGLIAEPSEYIEMANTLPEIHFITSQPLTWQKYAAMWIKRHIHVPYDIIFTRGCDAKLAILKPGDFLIEDSPLFSEYSCIIMVDRAYNQHVNCPIRVKSAEELRFVIHEIEDMGY